MVRKLTYVVSLAILINVVCLQDPEAANPADRKPSQYAPAKELGGQIRQYLERMSESLADANDYGDEQQSRLAKDASTVAALALVLGQHDDESELKSASKSIVLAARKLADNVKDYKAAAAGLQDLKQALEVKGAGNLQWQPAASLSDLMKQVPIVNNNLRRNVTGRRFKQTAEASAGMSVTLAAIAQVSRFDEVYCSNEVDKAKWDKVCIEMRDASQAVLAAIRKSDQAAATTALDALAKTCDSCHHDFRDK